MLTGRELGYEVEGHEVFSDVNISVSNGDKIGLVGPNVDFLWSDARCISFVEIYRAAISREERFFQRWQATFQNSCLFDCHVLFIWVFWWIL